MMRPPVAQNRRGFLRDVECPGEIHPHHALKFLQGQFLDRAIANDPGVVHENVEAAELLGDFLHHRLDLIGLRHVAFDHERVLSIHARRSRRPLCFFPPGSLMKLTTHCAPRVPKALIISAPMPRELPVTSTTLPVKSRGSVMAESAVPDETFNCWERFQCGKGLCAPIGKMQPAGESGRKVPSHIPQFLPARCLPLGCAAHGFTGSYSYRCSDLRWTRQRHQHDQPRVHPARHRGRLPRLSSLCRRHRARRHPGGCRRHRHFELQRRTHRFFCRGRSGNCAAQGAGDIAVFGGGGGTITYDDARLMKRQGVDQIFFAGTSLTQMADYVRKHYGKPRKKAVGEKEPRSRAGARVDRDRGQRREEVGNRKSEVGRSRKSAR